MKIGTMIAEKRKELGLTQSELAEKLNVSNKAVSKWEMETGEPSIKFLPNIAQILDITLDYLLTGEETYPDRQLFINGHQISKNEFAKLSKKEILAIPEKIFKNIPCIWLDEWSNVNGKDAINELYRKQYPNKYIAYLICGVDKLLNVSKISDTVRYFFDWDYPQFMKFRDRMLEQGYIEETHTGYYKLKERDKVKILEIVQTI